MRTPNELSTFSTTRSGLDRLRKTWPSRAAFEFVQRAEKRFAADNVDVNAGAVIVPVFVLKRRLGAVFPRHVILQRSQARAQFGIRVRIALRSFSGFVAASFFSWAASQESERCHRGGKGEEQPEAGSFVRHALEIGVESVIPVPLTDRRTCSCRLRGGRRRGRLFKQGKVFAIAFFLEFFDGNKPQRAPSSPGNSIQSAADRH